MDYVKEVVGDVTVPLYDGSKADPLAPIKSAKFVYRSYSWTGRS